MVSPVANLNGSVFLDQLVVHEGRGLNLGIQCIDVDNREAELLHGSGCHVPAFGEIVGDDVPDDRVLFLLCPLGRLAGILVAENPFVDQAPDDAAKSEFWVRVRCRHRHVRSGKSRAS